ncbi:MAG TPA: hypothetical protein VJM32_02730 [Candidatus Saccharimonadales bacterium]|nr:hypothetical protein [Candidatus Saccharimonadales bacterium]
MQALARVRDAWLAAAGTFTGDDQEFVHVNVTPGDRDGVLGMHIVLYANETTLWPDIAMSGQYVYQLPVLNAVRKIVEATQSLMRAHPNTYGWMPNELVALASTDRLALEAAGVNMYGPCTVPKANYSTVSKAADDKWIASMNDAQLKQLFASFDPWSRVLARFGFYNPEGVFTERGFVPPPKHWLNLMVVPARPLAEMRPHDLLAVVNSSQPGWSFTAGDNPSEFVPSIREVLSILEEHGL